jgi:hypothetical protein
VIKADCPGCGVVRLRAADLTVRVCTDDGSAAYCFLCDECGAAVTHPVAAGVADLLVGAGVRQVEWSLPDERDRRPDGPPFTPDDLLDFHLLLRSDEACDAQLRALLDVADRPAS